MKMKKAKSPRRKKAVSTVSKGRLPANKFAGGLVKSEAQELRPGRTSGGGSGGDDMEKYASKRNRKIRAQKRGY